jgi:hypothetical protein
VAKPFHHSKKGERKDAAQPSSGESPH